MGTRIDPNRRMEKPERAGILLRDLRPTGEAYERKEWIPVKLKKPTRDFCKNQAAQLSGKPYAPTDDEVAISVVIDALRDYCQSEAHVTRVVDKILHELPRWPDVTDIRDMAYELREAEAIPNPNCPECYGSGHRVVRKPVKTAWGVQDLEGSVKCGCWRYVKKAAS